MIAFQQTPLVLITAKIKIITTTIATVFMLGVILWEYFHGGVVSHHLLAQPDLPAVSNWWGILTIPVLTWILLGRIQNRLKGKLFEQKVDQQKKGVLVLFISGLIFGTLLSVSFSNQYTLFLDNVPYIILVLSLLIPIYYSEFILGFVLSMTITFGAILPMIAILIFASIGFIIYKFIRPLFLKIKLAVDRKS